MTPHEAAREDVAAAIAEKLTGIPWKRLSHGTQDLYRAAADGALTAAAPHIAAAIRAAAEEVGALAVDPDSIAASICGGGE